MFNDGSLSTPDLSILNPSTKKQPQLNRKREKQHQKI